tara:strand:+ start:423 stop:1160 length:738 start_codon:yes stop_codon:yes gene_type:complete
MYFSLQRNVTVGDTRKLLRLLQDSGHQVKLLRRSEGGICFLIDGKDIGKDLRFHGHGTPQQTFEINDNDSWDSIWLHYTPGLEEFDQENVIWADYRNRTCKEEHAFTKQEEQAIKDAIINAFGVLEHKIRNDGRRPQECDSRRDINLHFGFDYNNAVINHTKQHPTFPEERMFFCFACHFWRPDYNFEWKCKLRGYLSELESMSDHVLGHFAMDHAPCCDNCVLVRCHKSKSNKNKRTPKRKKIN